MAQRRAGKAWSGGLHLAGYFTRRRDAAGGAWAGADGKVWRSCGCRRGDFRRRNCGYGKTARCVACICPHRASAPAGRSSNREDVVLKHFYRGMAYEREHDYQRARAEYQLALDSGFQSAQLYNAIAWLDIEFLGADPVKVVGCAARALAMEPDNPDILDTYGWVLVKAGRHSEGLPLLEHANLMKPGIYCINVHLGVAYMKAGDRNRAADYLKRQIERNAADRWGRSAQLALDQLQGNAG